MASNIYDFSAKDAKGNDVSLELYKGKILLVVNTASKCGFTKQYGGLEELYAKYKDQGFEILAFPCNQFGAQEPGSDEEIQNFCDLNFKVSFKVFGKVDVNGPKAHPLFSYLSKEAKGLLGSELIKWNFTKFLVDENGKVLKRFAPSTTPSGISASVQELLH